MNRKSVPILILALVTLACGPLSNVISPTEAPAPTDVPAPTEVLEPTNVPAPAETAVPPAERPTLPPGAKPISQWAVSAAASSEYGSSDWSAMQATGAPNTPECGDYVTAWAAATAGTEEWIELSYQTPVRPLEVNIIQSYNPNQVVKVELIDNVSGYHEIFSGRPVDVDKCPFRFSIPVKDADYVVGGIRITIDQSVLQDWNEIDAVELVGFVPEE